MVSIQCMKKKLMIVGASVAGAFAVLVLVVVLMKSNQGAAREYFKVSSTADGQLMVHPPERNTSIVMSRASMSNLPTSLNTTVR